MRQNEFFNPTPMYREYMIMSIIELNPGATQRFIANNLGVSAALVNKYLEEYENNGLIKRIYNSRKDLTYVITPKGEKEKKNLNIKYLKNTLKLYKEAKGNVLPFLLEIYEKGYRNILLYGAGEVAELLLYIIKLDRMVKVNVLAIIDDDKNKVGKKLNGINIIDIKDINKYNYDGILIGSYNHQFSMINNLNKNNIKEEKIIHFLE